MKSEIHLFIIWEKGREKENKIINDIKKNFKILEVFEIHWSKKNYSNNLSRFYGKNLPPGSNKEKHCGTGPFLLLIVLDDNPIYSPRNTSKCIARVNINTFDNKIKYRSWTGGGHRIHATNTIDESSHDLALLLGSDFKYIKNNLNQWDNTIKIYKNDLIGAHGWKSIEELFYILNNTIKYVVLRNYDCLPDQYYSGKHGDIDLLTEDYSKIVYISNSKPVFKEPYRVHNKVNIGGEEVKFDFRYIGDNYYDEKWERDIIEKRVFLNKGFYIPDKTNYFYSLLYHALIHKSEISNDYINILSKINEDKKAKKIFNNYKKSNKKKLKSLLDNYLIKKGYKYTISEDKSVYLNRNMLNI